MNYYRYDNDIREWNVVFEDEAYTITYETAAGKYVHWVRPPKKPKEPELQVGDSSALDVFLGGFASA